MRWKLFAAFSLVALVAILGTLLYIRLDIAGRIEGFFFRGGFAGSEQLVSDLEAYYESTGSWAGAGAVLEGYRQPSGMGGMHGQGMGMNASGSGRFRLADSSGACLYPPALQGTQISADLQAQSIVLQDERGQTVGFLVIDGGNPLQTGSVRALIASINKAAVIGGLIAVGAALLFAVLLSVSFSRPIHLLTRAADGIARGDLSQRVHLKGRDEIASLGKTFNMMAGSLQSAEERKKALTADIAHELRTPLSIQKAHIEAMLDGVYPLSKDNLEGILDQNELLVRLVNDLRTLSLAEAGELQLKKEKVIVEELAASVLARFLPQAAERQIHLEEHSSGEAASRPLFCDPDRIDQILTNLLANALRYTPAGGLVSMTVRRSREGAEITVRDSGPGIPEDVIPHVFERFYRGESSRSREEGGSGLGLAISKQLALLHRGDLSASNDARGGAVFVLWLPEIE